MTRAANNRTGPRSMRTPRAGPTPSTPAGSTVAHSAGTTSRANRASVSGVAKSGNWRMNSSTPARRSRPSAAATSSAVPAHDPAPGAEPAFAVSCDHVVARRGRGREADRVLRSRRARSRPAGAARRCGRRRSRGSSTSRRSRSTSGIVSWGPPPPMCTGHARLHRAPAARSRRAAWKCSPSKSNGSPANISSRISSVSRELARAHGGGPAPNPNVSSSSGTDPHPMPSSSRPLGDHVDASRPSWRAARGGGTGRTVTRWPDADRRRARRERGGERPALERVVLGRRRARRDGP